MRETLCPKLPKWPFLVGDALLLAAAAGIYLQMSRPAAMWQLVLASACIALAAVFGMLPYILEYRGAARLTEADTLQQSLAQIQKLETVGAQISTATGHWQRIQETAEQTSAAAKKVADGMTAELKAFNAFMEKANDSERATLRLEIDKLRRAEGDWLKVLVRILDHIFALYKAALESRQPSLIEELDRFQAACCDAARRVGLNPFIPGESETFNPERHQVMEGQEKPGPESVIEQTIATGFTFQGRVLRPALVRLRNGVPPKPELQADLTGLEAK